MTDKAVHEHADVLRASIASAGNDHRLGASLKRLLPSSQSLSALTLREF